MKDKEMAEEYVDTLLDKDDAELDKFLDEYLGDLRLTKKQAGTLLGIIKGVGIYSYLAGLEAGRPKWHKVADGDLPKEEGDYLFYLCDKDTKFTFYEILGIARKYADRDDLYLESMIWTMNDVIAWCEIPQYTEE